MVNPNATLHYFYDPLCGWCYGAAPLIHVAAGLDGLDLQLHPGGMMSGERRQSVSPALRHYVMPHDARIAALTGQPFGDNYFDGLLLDAGATFDSTPPTLAIMAAEALGADPLAMLERLQQAHYAEGQRIADAGVLLKLAVELGLDAAAFEAEMQKQAAVFDACVDRTRQLMVQHNLRGFPSLLLEQRERLSRVDLSPFLGQPQAFAAHLRGLIGGSATADIEAGAAFCSPDGCN